MIIPPLIMECSSYANAHVTKINVRPKVAAIVKEWCLVHQAELQDNWQRAKRFEPLDRIQGADHD